MKKLLDNGFTLITRKASPLANAFKSSRDFPFQFHPQDLGGGVWSLIFVATLKSGDTYDYTCAIGGYDEIQNLSAQVSGNIPDGAHLLTKGQLYNISLYSNVTNKEIHVP